MAAITKVAGKRGIKYRAQVRRKGYPTLSETFTTRAKAVLWGKQQEGKIDTGKIDNDLEAKKHTLNDLIARYIEDAGANDKRIGQLNWWGDEIGFMRLSDISRATINVLITKLKKTPKRSGGKVSVVIPGTVLSAASINRYHAAISAVFKYGLDPLFWMETNPAIIRRQVEPKGIVRYLTAAERGALLTECKASEWAGLYPMIMLALTTGARQSNILHLRWSTIDLNAGTASVAKTKNGEAIVLPLVGEALDALKKWSKVRTLESDWVFPSVTIPSKVYANFRRHWDKAVHDSGVENFRFHDLRHTTATYLAKNGANQATIMSVMGHKTLAASQRYMHLDVEDNRKALEKVFGS